MESASANNSKSDCEHRFIGMPLRAMWVRFPGSRLDAGTEEKTLVKTTRKQLDRGLEGTGEEGQVPSSER